MRPQSTPLYLAGVGTISRMNEGIFKNEAEELCRIALAISPSTADRAKVWAGKRSSNTTLTECLLTKENIITPYSISNPLKVAVIMKFVSPMRSSYLIHLLKEAFRLMPAADFQYFATSVTNALGETINKEDEVVFYFFDNGDINITCNGIVRAIFNMPAVNRPLLDAFLHPTEGIVPELYENVTKNIANIRYDF